MNRAMNLNNTFHHLLLWVFLLVLGIAVTADGAGSNSAASNPRAKTTPASADANSIQVDLSDGFFIKFMGLNEDATIKESLRALAAKCQKNIVPSSKVDGPVGVTRLYNVTFEQALEAILGNDFRYEQKGDVIKVYTAEEFKKIKEDPARMGYKVFTLYYISAAEAKKLVTPIVSTPNGKIETTSAAATDFPTGASISTTSGGGDSAAMNDTIVVYDYPEKLEQIAAVLKEMDVRPRQVLIEATILAVTLTEDSQFGIDWQTLHGAITGVSTITKTTSDFFGVSGTDQVKLTGGLKIGFAHENIGAFIKAVETVSNVTILANPKILAVNKQLGQVYIGKKYGYESQTTANVSGFATSSVSFLDTGTKLSFRPYIGNDGYIRMDIHPKDSSGSLRTSQTATIPDETSAELVTNILVKDGQTVVIGGLFRDKITSNRSQVPLLGNLPILGVAFRGTADQVERQEVMVLLTPHIIEEPGQTDGHARAEDVRRIREGAKLGMQGIARPRLAENCYAKAAKHYVDGDIESALSNLKLALMLRPTYLEALRLQERIIAETDPEELKRIGSVIEHTIDSQQAPNWQRR